MRLVHDDWQLLEDWSWARPGDEVAGRPPVWEFRTRAEAEAARASYGPSACAMRIEGDDMAQGWIGVDLDGVLAVYPHSFPEIGPPIPTMVERVRGWLADGKDVRIFTARVAVVPGLRNTDGQEADVVFAVEQRTKIRAWCEQQFGCVLPVTATKDFLMYELWDDRCVQMLSNEGITVMERVRAIVNEFRAPEIPASVAPSA